MSDARARGEQLKRNRRKAPLLDEPTLKSLRSHTLSTLRREATERRKRELAEAQSVLQQAARLGENRTNAVSLGGVTMRMAAEFTAPVVASLAVDAPIHVSLLRREKAHAFTDFESIHVSLPESDFDRANDPDDLARLLSIAKGLIYHEAGHIVFTLPFEEMVEGAIQQGAVRPAEFRGRKGHAMLADDEQIELYRWVHNVLEDQRMECALVRLSPVLENHLRVTALYMLVEPAAKQGRTSAYWPLLSGRTYLSKDLLTRMRRLAYAEATAAGLAREFRVMEGAVRKYKRATTERELFEAVCQGVRAMRYWFTPHERRVMPKIDDHHDRERSEKVYERRRLADSATHDDFEPFEADENQPAAKTSSTDDTKLTGPQAARLDDGPIDSR